MGIPIIAHRTCPLDAPENSLSGIQKAAELGADAVEVDVRRSLEGVPVLMHDPSPWRTTHLPGPVRLYPAAVLRRARLQGTPERVPTLAEALDALPGDMALVLEIKEPGVARAALNLVREHRLQDRVWFWSYHAETIRYAAEQHQDALRTLLCDDIDPEGLGRYLDDAERCGAKAISPHWSAVTPQLIGEAHDRGLLVYPMTRDLETLAKKAAAGLDGIVTDHPSEARAILETASLDPRSDTPRTGRW